jgi:hypothetical protein
MVKAQQSLVDVVSRHLTTAQSEYYRRKKEQEFAMMRSMMGIMLGTGGAPSPGTQGGTQP